MSQWPKYIADEDSRSMDALSEDEASMDVSTDESDSLSSDVSEECRGYKDAAILLEILLATKSKSNSSSQVEASSQ